MKTRTMLRPWLLVAALAVLAVAVLAACGGSTASGSSPAATTPASTPAASPAGGGSLTSNEIAIKDFAFTPATTTVTAGTTVTWTNNDGATHNVTSTDGPGTGAATTPAFSSQPMAQGDTFAYTFKEAGTYYYECSIHASMASMHAVVIVE